MWWLIHLALGRFVSGQYLAKNVVKRRSEFAGEPQLRADHDGHRPFISLLAVVYRAQHEIEDRRFRIGGAASDEPINVCDRNVVGIQNQHLRGIVGQFVCGHNGALRWR